MKTRDIIPPAEAQQALVKTADNPNGLAHEQAHVRQHHHLLASAVEALCGPLRCHGPDSVLTGCSPLQGVQPRGAWVHPESVRASRCRRCAEPPDVPGPEARAQHVVKSPFLPRLELW